MNPEFLSEKYSWFKALGDEARRIAGFFGYTDERYVFNLFCPEKDATMQNVMDGTVTALKTNGLSMLAPSALRECKSLVYLDLGSTNIIYVKALWDCSKLKTLVLRSPTVCSVYSAGRNTHDVLYGTRIKSKSGYIYVPKNLVDSYKASGSSWSAYSTQIRAIEDYPEICGTTGG